MLRPLWITAALLGSILSAVPRHPAAAQPAEPAVVNAGETTVVARGTAKFTKIAPGLGSAASVESGGTPNSYALVYFPPAGTVNSDTKVQYTLEGEDLPRTVSVHIGAAAPTLDGDLYAKSFKALFVLFVLAILVENGLDLLFRWRPFVTYFDARSVNPIVSFVLSFVFIEVFNLDIVTGLLNVYSGGDAPPNLPGMVLTAMIVAGGSAGVNRIFRASGFRAPVSDAEMVAARRPPPEQAWLSVSLDPASTAAGTLAVLIGPAPTR